MPTPIVTYHRQYLVEIWISKEIFSKIMIQKTNLRPGNASVGLQSLGGDRHGSVLGASNGGGVVTFRREVRFGEHRSEVHERREEEEGLSRGRKTRRVCREAEDCQQEEIKCHKLLKIYR